MKLLKQSPNGKMIKVGDDEATGTWYYLTKETPLNDIKNGDDVTITFEKRGSANHLTSLQKGIVKLANSPTVNTAVQTKTVSKAPVNQEVEPKEPTKTHSNGDVWLAKDLRIQKQAIGHMTSRTLIAMQGLVNENNVLSLIETIYNKYKEKVC